MYSFGERVERFLDFITSYYPNITVKSLIKLVHPRARMIFRGLKGVIVKKWQWLYLICSIYQAKVPSYVWLLVMPSYFISCRRTCSVRLTTKLLFQGPSWSEWYIFFFVYLLFLKNIPRLKVKVDNIQRWMSKWIF